MACRLLDIKSLAEMAECWQIAQRVVSLTFRELPKIFSRNLCIAEMVLPMSISSLTLYVCPKPALGTYIKFRFEIRTMNVFSGIVYFR